MKVGGDATFAFGVTTGFGATFVFGTFTFGVGATFVFDAAFELSALVGADDDDDVPVILYRKQDYQSQFSIHEEASAKLLAHENLGS